MAPADKARVGGVRASTQSSPSTATSENTHEQSLDVCIRFGRKSYAKPEQEAERKSGGRKSGLKDAVALICLLLADGSTRGSQPG